MNPVPFLWLAAVVGFLLLEASTFSMTSVWFAVGAAKLRQKNVPTNGDRNLGREATVLTTVTADLPGRVRLDGVDWNARCATPGDILTPGQRCRVTELHSTLLIVEPVLTESRRA